MELLEAVKNDPPAGVDRDTAVVLLTSVDSVKTAVQAMQKGAADYLTKDSEWDEIVVHLEKVIEYQQRLWENQLLRRQVAEQSPFGEILSVSQAMNRIMKQVADIAPTQATVLITGETGVGKELIARAIHEQSARREGPFLDVNCAALPDDNMFQSELFGHERGAFTGAYEQRKGRFELAHGGTLFLDEVGDLSIDSQAKLLRVLENCTFERLGGSRKIKADVRFILATNHALQQEAEEGRFAGICFTGSMFSRFIFLRFGKEAKTFGRWCCIIPNGCVENTGGNRCNFPRRSCGDSKRMPGPETFANSRTCWSA